MWISSRKDVTSGPHKQQHSNSKRVRPSFGHWTPQTDCDVVTHFEAAAAGGGGGGGGGVIVNGDFYASK